MNSAHNIDKSGSYDKNPARTLNLSGYIGVSFSIAASEQ